MKKWISNTIKAVTVSVGIAVPVGLALYEPDAPTPFFPQTSIIGQNEAVVGELVRLKAHGEDVEWQILPEVTDYQVFGENNQNMVVSFRTDGDYTVVAAIITPEVELEIETLKIKVGNGNVVVIDPVVPVDPVDPIVPVKPPVNDSVTSQVATWAAQARLPGSVATELAKRFDQVADEVDRGEIATADGVVVRTSNLLGSMDLKPYSGLLENLQQLLTEQADSGRLVTQPDHSYLWRSVALGFRNYASVALSEPAKGHEAIATRNQ